MQLGLHTGSILYTNLLTDIRVAQETGYDAIEFYIPKLVRYLDAGYRAKDLLPKLITRIKTAKENGEIL